MQFISFRYTAVQARIIVLWRLGIRNMLWIVVFIPLASFILNEGMHLFGMRVSSVRYDPTMRGIYMGWAAFLMLLYFTIYYLGKKMTSQTYHVAFTDSSITIRCNETRNIVIDHTEINRADVGRQVVRINTPHGPSFLPAQIVPKDFLQRLKQDLEDEYHRQAWM